MRAAAAGAAAMALLLGFEASGREAPRPVRAPVDERIAEARRLGATVQRLWGLEKYAEARPLAERALSIRLEILGPDDSEVASSLYQIAELSRATGDYAGAMRLHRRAAAIWDGTLGPQNTESASSLHYLGVLHLTTGDLAGARLCFEKALAIREKVLGPMHEQVAATLNALAGVKAQAGDPAAAGPLLERAQAIWERTLGPEHPFIARSLTGRAGLLADAGDGAGARRLLEKALAIRTHAFGPEHYLVARSLADMANLAARAGDAAAAAPLYLRALEMQRRTLGPGHPEVASTLASLARIDWIMGRVDPALDRTLRAETIARNYFRRSARDLTDEEALQYEAIRTSGLDVALTALAAAAPGAAAPGPGDGVPAGALSPAVVRRISGEVIRSRAVVLDEMARGHRGGDGEHGTGHRRRPPAVDPGLDEVLASLPEGSALVTYIRYNRIDPPEKDMTRKKPDAAYLALLMKPRTEAPAAIPLGAAARIDALVADWRGEVSSDPRLRSPGAGERLYRTTGDRLREAIWDPLGPALEGIRMVFVVPDGAINEVSLATLPARGGGYLAESGPRVHYLSAPRDLLVERRPRASGEGVLVLGDPDFDAESENDAASADDVSRGGAPTCSEFAALRFEPLPGARAEAADVASLWAGRGGVLRLTGGQAGEAAFRKSSPGRRILHLATHAYFLPDRCGSSLAVPDLPDGPPIVGDRALLRSGLALAGANRRGDAGGPPGAEDGILTAEEIASLDLSRVEWAVLSACDSGAGDVLAGEGALGLRRAFEVAGARTLIMSLWAVDDGAARVWMRKLYAKRLSGLSTVDAVRRASLEILEGQRRQGRTTHPYFWGSFVAAGDWR